jgi:hypothetical protein
MLRSGIVNTSQNQCQHFTGITFILNHNWWDNRRKSCCSVMPTCFVTSKMYVINCAHFSLFFNSADTLPSDLGGSLPPMDNGHNVIELRNVKVYSTIYSVPKSATKLKKITLFRAVLKKLCLNCG